MEELHRNYIAGEWVAGEGAWRDAAEPAAPGTAVLTLG